MPPRTYRELFSDLLHDALVSLYDPRTLHRSALVQLFGLEQRRDTVTALRDTICVAIETLQPNINTPRDSKIWRSYHILRRRYIEQIMQREVALDLGLSTRQLQRDETQARETLADYLWDAFDIAVKIAQVAVDLPLESTIFPPAPTQPLDAQPLDDSPTREQELEFLRLSTPEHITDVDEFIRDALHTAQPLFNSRGVAAEYHTNASGKMLYVQVGILRQVIINVVGMALHCSPQNVERIQVNAQVDADHLRVIIQALGGTLQNSAESVCDESLEMAQDLIRVCGGHIEVEANNDDMALMTITITLPLETSDSILVIDDNSDTRQLLQRYLQSTPYRFLGAADSEHGFALAIEQQPSLIMLDVMMPGQDGWAMLGRLREHPKTEDIPVVVCTILAQDHLALALGAAEFIRKPLNRDRFLATVDRHLPMRALRRG